MTFNPSIAPSTEHRDGGCDDAVTIEKRAAEEPEHDEGGAATASGFAFAAHDERKQGVHTALTLVVCTQDEADVLDRDDQHQRPDNERQQPVDALRLRLLRHRGARRASPGK
jgi:hypothetical protein